MLYPVFRGIYESTKLQYAALAVVRDEIRLATWGSVASEVALLHLADDVGETQPNLE